VKRIVTKAGRTSVYAQFTVRVPDRERIQSELKKAGIPTAVHYPLSLHQQPAYAASYKGLSYPVSETLAREVMSLPMSADLSEADQQHVVEAIGQALRVAA
jgi:UDP-2-acetamido-2-deoxy-ribo-hexuluronate aminotransferase